MTNEEINELKTNPQYEFYEHDKSASVYVLVFKDIGYYIGYSTKSYNGGFQGCLSTYTGSGNTLSYLKKLGKKPKMYILASGSRYDMKLLEDRLLAKHINKNANLNITLGTLNAMEAIQEGVCLCEAAETRLNNISKHFQELDEEKVLFDSKRTKIRENSALRSELLQLAILEATHKPA